MFKEEGETSDDGSGESHYSGEESELDSDIDELEVRTVKLLVPVLFLSVYIGGYTTWEKQPKEAETMY